MIVHTALFKLYAPMLVVPLVVLSLIFSVAAKQSSLFCSTPKWIRSFRKVFVKTLKDLYVLGLFRQLKSLLATFRSSVICELRFYWPFFLTFKFTLFKWNSHRSFQSSGCFRIPWMHWPDFCRFLSCKFNVILVFWPRSSVTCSCSQMQQILPVGFQVLFR